MWRSVVFFAFFHDIYLAMRLKTFWTYAITLTILAAVWVKSTQLWPPPKEYPSHVHKTLYVDRHFTNDQFVLIAWAAIRWSQATNHIIDYDVIRLPMDHEETINSNNAIIVMMISPDHPNIITLDKFNMGTTLGLYNPDDPIPTISFVEGRFDDADQFEQAAMHEMGHSVGLHHNHGIEGTLTLMFPSIGLAENYITEKDMINFCKLYHCNPNQLQHEKEPPHF